MKKTPARILAVAIAILLALSLSACGDSFESAMTRAVSEMQDVESLHMDMVMGIDMSLSADGQTLEMPISCLLYTSGEYTVGGGIGLVFGNILVMVLEAVLVCIQTLRLEFYELFGRFYTGRGMPFRPVTVDYSDVAARAA